MSTNLEHAALARQLAEVFGNEHFDAPYPRDEMLHLIEHHDHGWAAIDGNPPLNPENGLPYHLGQTPIEWLVASGRGSPDFNERYSPAAGLLSSMHTYGLYHGRYGLSDKVTMDAIPPEAHDEVHAMLEGELERQERLTGLLAGTEWQNAALVLWNYKLLQFFDTAALYFNLSPAGHRDASEFQNVPQRRDRDICVSVRELEPGTYAWEPFPFREEGIEVFCAGRWVASRENVASGAELMASAAVEKQWFRLVAG